MRHVVGGVKVLAIPAGGEAEGSHDTFFTFAIWKCDKFWGSNRESIEAGVGQLTVAGRFGESAGLDVADEHTEPLRTRVNIERYDRVLSYKWDELQAWRG